MKYDKTPPHCAEVEARIVGAMFQDGEDGTIPIIHAILGDSSEVFWCEKCRIWYDTMIAMWKAGDIVRMDTVVAKMNQLGIYEKAGGFSQQGLLAREATIEPYFDTYCRMILDAHYRRSLIRICQQSETKLHNMNVPLVSVRRDLEAAAFHGAHTKAASKPESISVIAERQRERLAAISRKEIGRGIKTGLDNIDRLMLPMQPGDYVILAARTSVGKTTLGCNIALNAAAEGVGILFFSLEMTKDAIFDKFIQIDSGVDMSQIQREYFITDEQQKRIEASVERLEKMNIVIDEESGMTPTHMRSKARSVCAKNAIGLIVVDYIGMLQVPGMNDLVAMTSTVSREIKAMAKELKVPVLALCQINRDGANVRPALNNLRQSGSLEQDCDIAILLHRPNDEDHSKYVTAIIAKQRVGPIGDAALIFNKPEQRFFDSDRSGEPVQRRKKDYTRSPRSAPVQEPINHLIEYDYFEEDDTPF